MTHGATDVRIQLSVAPQSAAAARDAMDGFADEVRPETLDDLRLLVSELVTNAYRHGRLRARDRIELRGRIADGRVRLEVLDPGRGFVPPDPPIPREDRGWGLYLVDYLADRWGVEVGRRTLVWAEVDIP